MKFQTLTELIEAAYKLRSDECLEIRASDLAILGGPTEQTAEGSLGNVTYHYDDEGRAWATWAAPPAEDGESRFFAVPSDHPVTRRTPAIIVLECY